MYAEAIGILKIPSDDFWYLTPKEYYLILKAHYNESSLQQKEILEAIRLQTFHLASLKPGINYKLFCNKYFPFTWDKQTEDKKKQHT